MPQQDDPGVRRPAASGIDANEIERVLPACVVHVHPVQLTFDELVRELTNTPDDFGSRDRIAVAVRQLETSAREGLIPRAEPVPHGGLAGQRSVRCTGELFVVVGCRRTIHRPRGGAKRVDAMAILEDRLSGDR